MIYRLLGNTGLSVSAIGLGGHWCTHDGKRYCDRFDRDEVPAEVIANRAEVVAAALDAGINYLDITTGAEAMAYGRVLGALRERFIVGADDYQWSARNPAACNVSALVANVERILLRLRTDCVDLWRVTAEVHGRNTDSEVEAVIEAADRLRQAGKIRFLGMSSHDPGWIQRAVARFDALQVAIIPCTGLGCGRHSPAEPPEPMRTIVRAGRGLMTIKPFAGGLLFKSGQSGDVDVDAHRLARLTLRHIMESRPEIGCVLAGMRTVNEIYNAAEAATMSPLSEQDREWLDRTTAARLGVLPAEYAWLDKWSGQ